MAKVPIKLVVRNYDIITPLALGDVEAEGIDLTIDREAPISSFGSDPSYQAGETSFSKYLIGLSKGERNVVGLPVYPMRAFRHRCFFVHRDSGLTSFKDLEGKRIGTNGWFDTGNTWSRAAMRREGVDLKSITWWVGTIDGVTDQAFGHTSFTNVPPHVSAVAEGSSLADMLLKGDLDAMMVPWEPRIFHEPNSPIVRLLPDYKAAEKAYYEQVGFYPAHHLIGLRRDVFEEHPWVARSLFEAFERSRLLSQERRWALTDITPWFMSDLEETASVFGRDWQPFGVEPNRAMIATLAHEQEAQGLVEKGVDPAKVFADFEQAAKG